MKKIVKFVGILLAFVAFAMVASPQSARAAHSNYRVKTLKTYRIQTNSGSNVAFHAKPGTKATLWVNPDSVNAKQIKSSVFHKKALSFPVTRQQPGLFKPRSEFINIRRAQLIIMLTIGMAVLWAMSEPMH